jgi:ABC-type Fe3+ transport system permease subunit
MIGVLGVIGLFITIPIGSLVWKLGLHGYPVTWSVATAKNYFEQAAQAHAGLIAGSLAAAAAAGVLASGLALLACWLARDSWTLRVMLAVVVALAWAMPGPVVGAGLKLAIEWLIDIEEHVAKQGPIWSMLYNGPSDLPVVWAYMLRFFPCAVALIWPAVRLIPGTLTDAARVDGASPFAELRCAVWPLAAPAVGRAAVAVAVLALGELSASKLVATPGDQVFGATFAHVVWSRMHYGVANQLAALCLLLLAAAIVPTTLLVLFSPERSGSEPTTA